MFTLEAIKTSYHRCHYTPEKKIVKTVSIRKKRLAIIAEKSLLCIFKQYKFLTKVVPEKLFLRRFQNHRLLYLLAPVMMHFS